MEKPKRIVLVKCPKCGRAFYLKTRKKGEIEIKCPYCEKKVMTKINGIKHNGTSQSQRS